MQRRILIKIGGRAFEGRSGFAELAKAIAADPSLEIVIVHGGGSEISDALKAAGRPTEFIDGIRVTRAEDIRIVEQVLSETVNRRIAGWLEASGVLCRRLSGKTEGLLVVEPMTRGDREYGFVGEIVQVNPQAVERAFRAGYVPVISPISADSAGGSYNVNADSAAAALAAALGCTDLLFITDVPGVLIGQKPQARLTVSEAARLIAEGDIRGGMVAKIESARTALEKGVNRVYIGQWSGADTLAEILAGNYACGTSVRN